MSESKQPRPVGWQYFHKRLKRWITVMGQIQAATDYKSDGRIRPLFAGPVQSVKRRKK